MNNVNISNEDMLKKLSLNLTISSHKDFVIINNEFEKNKHYIHPSINGIDSYLKYINIVDIITKLY